MTAVPHCPDCGAALTTNVCPVCQEFDPVLPRSSLLGAAFLGLIAGALLTAGWVGLLWWKWERWQARFERPRGHPQEADAWGIAVALTLLVFAVAAVSSTVLVAARGRYWPRGA